MARGKKEFVGWDERTVFDLIREGLPAQEIIDKSSTVKEKRISLGTLQKKVLQLQAIDNKLYNIENITGTPKPARITGLGNLTIPKALIADSPFQKGDEFDVKIEKDRLILTKKK